MRHPCLIALALFAATPAVAAEDLNALLDKLAPGGPVVEGKVGVVARVERGGAHPELVVTLVPQGHVKIVANPGVTVTPEARAGVEWVTEQPTTAMTGEPGAYFAMPPELRLPFAAEDGKPIDVAVDYAYCVVDYQCLFGQETVSVATKAP